MPRLTRLFIHSSLIYLVVGFTLGGLILTAKAVLMDARVWAWLLPHADILVVGWLVQLAMGVAFWILPRIREAYRGRTALAWASFYLLNGGVTVGAGVTLMALWFPGRWAQVTFVSGLACQVVALGLYAFYAWPRILPTITAADVKRKAQQKVGPTQAEPEQEQARPARGT